MSGGWKDSKRRTQLPPDWAVRRAAVFARDGHRCMWVEDGTRCPQSAAEVDHVKRDGSHDLNNLRALCAWHHRRKSSAEGNAARRRPSTRRTPEPHPGTLHARG